MIEIGNPYDFDDVAKVAIDNRLGHGIAAGDEQAFNLFVYRWRGYAVRYARSRLFDRDIEDAQEIANDVFLHLRDAAKTWGVARRYEEIDFIRFFYGVVRLQTTWKLQQIGNRRKRAARDYNEFAQDTCRVTIDVSDYIDFEEHLDSALLRLKPLPRLAFILRHMEGYRTNEVARILNISTALVSYHEKEVCKRLRKTLSDWN